MAEPTLYERLGGVYAISAVVDYFSDQLLDRDTLEAQNPYIKDCNEIRLDIACRASSSSGRFGSARLPADHSNTRAYPWAMLTSISSSPVQNSTTSPLCLPTRLIISTFLRAKRRKS
jgi:hypothetical protein